ncbi:MAG: hypothetical protein WC437_00515 [Patescibacteria group bacterium]|jgi:hypothetical protein|nr:hypothetical protein [Patescibacteria group bacterium]
MEEIEEKSDLSWTKADFLRASLEVPDRLEDDDIHSEGELMSIEEVAEWGMDTQKTFIIIKQENSKLFEKLYQKYVLDVHYLTELGKITEEDADELLKIENFEI